MLREIIQRQKDWSLRTFGKGKRTEGICKHIEKGLAEIRSAPDDLTEWIDVIILALDGAWRAGHSPVQIINALIEKQAINLQREFPMPTSEDEPSEHIH